MKYSEGGEVGIGNLYPGISNNNIIPISNGIGTIPVSQGYIDPSIDNSKFALSNYPKVSTPSEIDYSEQLAYPEREKLYATLHDIDKSVASKERNALAEALGNKVGGIYERLFSSIEEPTIGKTSEQLGDTANKNTFEVNPRIYINTEKVNDYLRKYGVDNMRYLQIADVRNGIDPRTRWSYAEGGKVDMFDVFSPQNKTEVNGKKFSDDEMRQIVKVMELAITKQIPNAEEVIKNFIAIFGEEEYNRLKEVILGKSHEGPVSGRGTGTSDSIPATINGVQPAKLSDGEYVIPSDVVTAIGDGSSEFGSKKLNDMIGEIRKGGRGLNALNG